MKRLFILIMSLTLLSILLIGCGKSKSTADQVEEKVPVEITTIQLGDVIQSINYNGDIKAEFEVKVFSKIPDRIEKFFVDEGSVVKKGDPIAQITATTIEQAVRQAQAGLEAAQAQEANLKVEFDRAQRLNSENAISKQQFDATKTQYEAVKAQLEQAKAGLTSIKSQLKDATVSAPISGIIGNRYLETGDMANPAMPLVTIVQMSRVKITFNATEEDLGKLAVGQKANITVKSYPGRLFEGKVTKISPVLDPFTRMAEIEVMIENSSGVLKPGMYAQVDVIIGIIKNTMVVPRFSAIESTTMENLNGSDQVVKNYYVFVVDNGRAIQKKLDVFYVNHKSLAVRAGIQIGDKLVITGQNNLRDSMAVTIAKEEGNAL